MFNHSVRIVWKIEGLLPSELAILFHRFQMLYFRNFYSHASLKLTGLSSITNTTKVIEGLTLKPPEAFGRTCLNIFYNFFFSKKFNRIKCNSVQRQFLSPETVNSCCDLKKSLETGILNRLFDFVPGNSNLYAD